MTSLQNDDCEASEDVSGGNLEDLVQCLYERVSFYMTCNAVNQVKIVTLTKRNRELTRQVVRLSTAAGKAQTHKSDKQEAGNARSEAHGEWEAAPQDREKQARRDLELETVKMERMNLTAEVNELFLKEKKMSRENQALRMKVNSANGEMRKLEENFRELELGFTQQPSECPRRSCHRRETAFREFATRFRTLKETSPNGGTDMSFSGNTKEGSDTQEPDKSQRNEGAKTEAGKAGSGLIVKLDQSLQKVKAEFRAMEETVCRLSELNLKFTAAESLKTEKKSYIEKLRTFLRNLTAVLVGPLRRLIGALNYRNYATVCPIGKIQTFSES